MILPDSKYIDIYSQGSGNTIVTSGYGSGGANAPSNSFNDVGWLSGQSTILYKARGPGFCQMKAI
jgi:hypothetical protein